VSTLDEETDNSGREIDKADAPSASSAPLTNARHERFCQLRVSGLSATDAYEAVYGVGKSSATAASRLSSNVNIIKRIAQLQKPIVESLVHSQVTDRNERIAALQRRYDALSSLIEARAADPEIQKVPGGKTGLVVITGYQRITEEPGGKQTTRRIAICETDVATLRELRATLRQAAEECGQWNDKGDSALDRWDGDPGKLTPAQRQKMLNWLANEVYPGDPDARKKADDDALRAIEEDRKKKQLN
jgi:hypothetical protein